MQYTCYYFCSPRLLSNGIADNGGVMDLAEGLECICQGLVGDLKCNVHILQKKFCIIGFVTGDVMVDFYFLSDLFS